MGFQEWLIYEYTRADSLQTDPSIVVWYLQDTPWCHLNFVSISQWLL